MQSNKSQFVFALCSPLQCITAQAENVQSKIGSTRAAPSPKRTGTSVESKGGDAIATRKRANVIERVETKSECGEAEPSVQESMEVILFSAESMMMVLNDVLLLSQIEARKLKVTACARQLSSWQSLAAAGSHRV